MAYTPFGEFVRILRIKHHQVMGDMAKILGTSTPFLSAVENGKLSAVENGKKNVPAEWIERLADYYGLSPAERTQLETSAEESRLQYKIIPGNAGTNQRRAALQFARSFDEMDDETALKILELLRNKEDID